MLNDCCHNKYYLLMDGIFVSNKMLSTLTVKPHIGVTGRHLFDFSVCISLLHVLLFILFYVLSKDYFTQMCHIPIFIRICNINIDNFAGM